MAKIYSRVILNAPEERKEYLIKSLENYKWISNFLNKMSKKQGINSEELD